MEKLRVTIGDILALCGPIRHSFIKHHKRAKASAFIVVSSDKSLCGAFNLNVTNTAIENIRRVDRPVVFTVGRHGESMLRARGIKVERGIDVSAPSVSLDQAGKIADEMIERFIDDEFDEVHIVFTRYRDQLHQDSVCIRLFPLAPEDFDTDGLPDGGKRVLAMPGETIFEPGVEEVIETLVNEYVTGMIYSALIQSAMSEHIARMNAMQAATRNADEMIASLRLQYNSARQLAITSEISEIAAASEIFGRGI